jgi:hypothetical protein
MNGNLFRMVFRGMGSNVCSTGYPKKPFSWHNYPRRGISAPGIEMISEKQYWRGWTEIELAAYQQDQGSSNHCAKHAFRAPHLPRTALS